MVNYNHVLKPQNVGKTPVKQWYQSLGSRSWDLPTTTQSRGGFYNGKYLLRETPTRIGQWSSRKKSISPKGKEMLVKQVLENQTFNDGKLKQKQEKMKSKREKRSKCYICKEKGHSFWASENRKRIAAVESKQHDLTSQILQEEVKYPETVHVIGDFMIEGSQHNSWNEIWYVSSHYKFHLCPRRNLFKRIKYSFKMIGKEETERKFIFSYGLGSVVINTDEGEMVIPNVQYTPEVSLNILSYDLLEEQGYLVNVDNTKCTIRHMYEEEKTGKERNDGTPNSDETLEQKQAVEDHNQYLDKYFESIDPKEECSLIKGLEELSWDKNDVHDYIDNDYISWNGTLYALKVNSFNRFVSFINLLKNDAIVYKHWSVFSQKYHDMIKWFYMEYLNCESMEEIPPTIGNIKIDLLALHKAVENLGGYVAVSLSEQWSTIAYLQGLTTEEGDAIKGCFKHFIDLIMVYHDTAQITWTMDKPAKEIGESSWTAECRYPQGLEDCTARNGQDDQEEKRLGVRNKGKEVAETSSSEENDFEVIL